MLPQILVRSRDIWYWQGSSQVKSEAVDSMGTKTRFGKKTN